MTRHERLLENYEDAYFALLMEDVAQMDSFAELRVGRQLP